MEAVAALDSTPFAEGALRLRDLVRALSAEEIPLALEEVRKHKDPDPYALISALASRWAEIDLHGAIDHGLAWKDDENKKTFFAALVSKWMKTNFSAASAWAQSQPPGPTRDAVISTMAGELQKHDPKEALALARHMSTQQGSEWIATQIFTEWIHSDPAAVAAACGEWNLVSLHLFDSTQPLPRSMESIGEIWGRKDPKAALAWAAGLPPTSASRDMLKKISESWAKRDPAAALAWISHSEDKSLHPEVINTAIGTLAAKDLSAAMAQIEALPADERSDATLAAALKNGAKTSPETAARLFQQLPEGTPRNEAALSICKALAATDPRNALDWLVHQAPQTISSGQGSQVSTVLQNWLAKSPGEAVAWTRGLPPGKTRDIVLNSTVSLLVNSDLKLAQSVFEELSPQAQGEAAAAFAQHYATQDIDEARAWAAALPGGRGQSMAFQALADVGAETDPQEAAKWINTLPQGDSRDRAIIPFTRKIMWDDPDGAMDWALSISDPMDRQDQLDEIAERWNQFNPRAAQSWINSCPQLTPEQRRHLLTK